MGHENWRPIDGYDGKYLVSDTGLIYSNIKNKVLKPNVHKNGYMSVELFKNKQSKRILIHRIVAQTFLNNPNHYPIVNHKDEDPSNNHVDNLEWCTYKYNVNYGNAPLKKKQNMTVTDKIRKNLLLGAKSRRIPILQYDELGNYVGRYDSVAEAGRKTNTNVTHISEVCKNKRKSAGGYHWQYERSVDLSEY